MDDVVGGSWTSLWAGYVVCGHDCRGIRHIEKPCPACGGPPYDLTPETFSDGEFEFTVPRAFMGAEGRYEDYVYLEMLQREWEPPAEEFGRFVHFPGGGRPSPRAALVLLFWTYFETRLERLHRTAMRSLPKRVLADQLRRYSGIGSRLFDLDRINFSTTYFDDLATHGFEGVSEVMKDIHRRRNDFAHGNPQAIDDATVQRLVKHLKDEHEAWIAVFNARVRSGLGET
jgi:hypothetical protein